MLKKKNIMTKSDSDDDLSIRLKELLNDTDEDSEHYEDYKRPQHSNNDKYSRTRQDPYSRDRRVPPTLAELEREGVYHGS